MRAFVDWSLDVLFQNRFCLGEQKAPTSMSKGWINSRTGKIVMWTDLQKWHAQKMLSNTSDFPGIDRDELMDILGEEEYEELLRGYLDRDEVPAYVAYTDSKNWFAFVAGSNIGGVYTENLKQARECLRWFQKKGWTWKDFFPTAEASYFEINMHGGQAQRRKRGRISWNHEFIKDAGMWDNFIKTGRIQDTSKRSEIGSTMAMFRDWVEMLDESFDKAYPIDLERWTTGMEGMTTYKAQTKAGVLRVEFGQVKTSDPLDYQYSVDFKIDNRYTQLTKAGEPLRVLATVMNAIEMFIDMHKRQVKVYPTTFTISTIKRGSADEVPGRHKVYLRMVKRFASKFGYSLDSVKEHGGKQDRLPMMEIILKLKNKQQQSESVEFSQLDESNLKVVKAWIKGNKMISWIPRSTGEPYHLQVVVKNPKKYGLDREGIEKILKQRKWLEYPVYYDALVDGEEDRHEGLYTEMFANDWVMVVVQDYGRATIGSLHGKNTALVHAAAKKMMEDKSFQKIILGADALEMEINPDPSGGLYGSGKGSQRMSGVDAWMSYVESGHVATRRKSGVAMFRDWVEFSQKDKGI